MHRELATTVLALARGLDACDRSEDRALAERWQAALAPLLARVTLGETVLGEIDGVDRLLAGSRLADPAPFEEAVRSWARFRDEYEGWVLGGMTVNERLHELGLAEAYEEASRAGDAAELRRLLERVRVDAGSIAVILRGL